MSPTNSPSSGRASSSVRHRSIRSSPSWLSAINSLVRSSTLLLSGVTPQSLAGLTCLSGHPPVSLTLMSSNSAVDLTPALIEQLHQQAAAAAHHAYAPYSNFRVGAALLLDSGAIVTGCNVENASYRLTTCAEQNAIAAAVSLHGPAIRIRAIVIANLNRAASQPCGACRQNILEFSTPDTSIFFPKPDGTLDHATIADLLPAAFLLKK
ncbi:MAG: cytidine deaminase [Edaphobacter sp.]